MTQVNRDNVLQVRNSIRLQADQIRDSLQTAQFSWRVEKCGGDPISADATIAFNRKINEVLAVHWSHHKELIDAADRLNEVALTYGYTEAQIADSWSRFQAAL